MGTWVALLRAVNLGGHGKVGMAELRAAVGEWGCTHVQTVLQSGNLVFGAAEDASAGELEAELGKLAAERLGLKTEFFVRSAAEWAAVVAANPFGEAAERDPSHLLVVCLQAAPAAGAVEGLRAAIVGPEIVEVVGRQLYAVFPAGIGTSKLTMAVIERKLGTRGTGRNWNTVLKLRELATSGG